MKTKTFNRIAAFVVVFIMGFAGCFSTAFAESADMPENSTGNAVVEEDSVADMGTEGDSADADAPKEELDTEAPDADASPGESDADDSDTDKDVQADKKPSTKIVAIKALKSGVKKQTIEAYSGKKPTLPKTISVKLSDKSKYQNIKINWKCTKTFLSKKAGTYTYKGTIAKKYTLAKGVKLPVITVKVTKTKTKINGVANTFTKKSRKTLTDTVTVYNGYGSKLRLQMYTDGKWVTKKTIQLKNKSKQVVKVKYTKDWWTVSSSKWRMKINSTNGKTGYISKTTKVTTKRYYQNPSRYVQIQDNIEIDDSGAYSFGVGYMGLKVRAVNRYFGIGDKNWPRYTSTTKSKVMDFQRKKGLKVTGVVNKATWNAFGFSDYNWKYLGAYVSPIAVDPSSTKEDHIEAMIDRAYDYLGADYVVGASGLPEKGADCSGLVMQALYAAGIEIEGINPVTHSRPGHEFESRNMWEHADFKKISYSKKKRGDLIFYKGSSGLVNHVAIYLGNGKVIESWPDYVRIASVGHHPIMGVMRVFN